MSIAESTSFRTCLCAVLATIFLLLAGCFPLPAAGNPEPGRIFGKVLDPQGAVVAAAHLMLVDFAGALALETTSDVQGNFSFDKVAAGKYQLRGESEGFAVVSYEFSLAEGHSKELIVQFLQVAAAREQFTVVASAPSSLTPDPSETVVIHDQVLDAKPLGDGFTGVPVVEVRGALLRPFLENRMSVGANFLIASGYTGQTTETIGALAGPCAVECVVGVPLKSYVSLSWTYYFRK